MACSLTVHWDLQPLLCTLHREELHRHSSLGSSSLDTFEQASALFAFFPSYNLSASPPPTPPWVPFWALVPARMVLNMNDKVIWIQSALYFLSVLEQY